MFEPGRINYLEIFEPRRMKFVPNLSSNTRFIVITQKKKKMILNTNYLYYLSHEFRLTNI